MVMTRRGSAKAEKAEQEAPSTPHSEAEHTPEAVTTSGLLEAAPRLLAAFGMAILKTIFATDAINATHRTALFLMFFLVVHCGGNLLVFIGADAFNAYGHLLHVNPLLKLIESYLALATIFHACGGLYLTYKKRKFITKGSPSTVAGNAKMALSSLVVLAFVIVHLIQFRFGAWYDYLSTMDVTVLSESGLETVPKGTAMRDIYRLEKEVFASPLNAWGYALSILALGGHLWWGWARAVGRMGLDKRDVHAAEVLGKLVIAPLVAAFVAQPMYVLYVVNKVA